MDRLWALKKDFDPFGRLFYGFSAIGFLLRITRCTIYSCPYCRWPCKIAWGPSNTLLGSGDRVCWHCRQAFWDGSNEWPEMSSQDRYSFLVPITVAGYLAAVLLIGGLLVYDHWYLRNTAIRVDPTVAVVLLLPLPVWFVFRSAQVIRSVHRYNDRGKTSTS
jgi:hypothetical protein